METITQFSNFFMFYSILSWLVLCIMVMSIGSERKIGAIPSLVGSILLTPIIMFLFVLASERISDSNFKTKLIKYLSDK